MIRPARKDDMADITRIRTSVRENHLSVEEMAGRGITPEIILSAIDAGTLAAWVMESGNEIVAFVMADLLTGRVFALFTDPSHQGKGHGSALLSVAEHFLLERGQTTAILDTGEGTGAEGFYLRRGYEITQVEDGDVHMRKSLARTELNQP